MPDDALTTSGSYPSFRLAMGSVLAARNDGIVLATSINGTNDLIISQVVRRNEQQVWFVAEHLVDTPLVRAF